jgi:type IV secretory pathway ATPase VirB11/archaellum biosynthesis ATPase
MANINSRWTLKEEDFGPLWEYIKDDSVTDITLNCDGKELWITSLDKGKYRVDNHGCDRDFVTNFTHRVSNKESKQFNKMEPLL